jgi:hypothetical protein
MKSPYTQRPDDLAREATEEFIAVHGRTRSAAERVRGGEQPAADAAEATAATE